MEAATVARFARAKNLGFLCFKAVTDGPNDELPDFNRFTTPEGRLRTSAFAAWALFHPQYWRVLGELEKNSRLAARGCKIRSREFCFPVSFSFGKC